MNNYCILVLALAVSLCSGFLEGKSKSELVDEVRRLKQIVDHFNKICIFQPPTTLELCTKNGKCAKSELQSNSPTSICYKEIVPGRNYSSAQEFCARKGGRMMEIHDNRTLNFILDNLKNMDADFYVGATLRVEEDRWRWASEWDMTLDNWYDNNPDNYYGDEYCVGMSSTTGKWFDLRCVISFNFLCETATKVDCATW